MEYALLAALGLGIFLLLLGWLMVTIAGFRHHPVTGLFTLLPVLNLLILPTIWHRAGIWFITGVVGVIIAAGAWFAGASQAAGQQLAEIGVPVAGTTTAMTDMPSAVSTPTNNNLSNSNNTNTQTLNTNIPSQQLPNTALYQINVQEINTEQLNGALGKYVRIQRNDNRVVEGKLLQIDTKSIIIELNQEGQLQQYQMQLAEVTRVTLINN